MSEATFLIPLNQPTAKNATNVPAMIDDTVTAEERTTGRMPTLRGQHVGFEFGEALRYMLIGGLVIGGLLHLVEKGLFN